MGYAMTPEQEAAIDGAAMAACELPINQRNNFLAELVFDRYVDASLASILTWESKSSPNTHEATCALSSGESRRSRPAAEAAQKPREKLLVCGSAPWCMR